jgi:hypothetical protein
MILLTSVEYRGLTTGGCELMRLRGSLRPKLVAQEIRNKGFNEANQHSAHFQRGIFRWRLGSNLKVLNKAFSRVCGLLSLIRVLFCLIKLISPLHPTTRLFLVLL